MFKIIFLRNLLLLTIALAASFPLYDFFYTYPAYSDVLIEQTESEASRFVRFLVAVKRLDRFNLDENQILPEITEEIQRMKGDALITKLRIFSSTGRIVYSTQADEYGTVNTNSYFTQLVAKGKIYSKVVKKDELTADGALLTRDVSETYVPIMVDGRFHGAIEVYHDITEDQARLHLLNMKAAALLVVFSATFVLLMFIGLKRAKNSFLTLQKTEGLLQVANESLEKRVTERTNQLQQVNDKLSAEIQVRLETEAALQNALVNVSDARDKIDTILSSVADALIVTDGENHVVHMNKVAERFFRIDTWQTGVHFQQLINNPALHQEIAIARQRLMDQALVEFDLDLFAEGNPGQQILAARVSRLLSEQGEDRGMVIFMQDVTKVRNVERMKSEFVSIAAHELRTPLTMILGYSELLLDNRNFSEDEEVEFLGVINRKAIDLAAIVDDLLDVTRIEEGRALELYLDKVDVGQLIASAVSEAELRAKGSHNFVVSLPEDTCFLVVDQGRMHQVLENLLSNAVKYSPQGGEITIALSLRHKTVDLTIMDQGIGMTLEHSERVFERFYRVDSSDAGVRGVGLGLSIVKYIVEAHGGSVAIDSRIGQGTSVVVSLPG